LTSAEGTAVRLRSRKPRPPPAYGPDNPWYRRAAAAGSGRIHADGVERDVTFTEAADDAHTASDAACHAQYHRHGPRIVGTVVGPQPRAVTVRIVPRRGMRAPPSCRHGRRLWPITAHDGDHRR
jgi:hypothetical protein